MFPVDCRYIGRLPTDITDMVGYWLPVMGLLNELQRTQC